MHDYVLLLDSGVSSEAVGEISSDILNSWERYSKITVNPLMWSMKIMYLPYLQILNYSSNVEEDN